jgi:menaquinone-dependent protoporphyrinogen oxidase
VAERIAGRMRDNGLDVHLDPLLGREQVGRFQAVVLGSPLYSGEWESEAVDFCRRNAAALAGHPVWTFSVGWPDAGSPDAPHADAKNLPEVQRLVAVREHRYFLGALDPAELPPLQRLVFRLRGHQAGDLRDWAAIDAWTDEIAGQLASSASASVR